LLEQMDLLMAHELLKVFNLTSYKG
jgi:hypothetical protein